MAVAVAAAAGAGVDAGVGVGLGVEEHHDGPGSSHRILLVQAKEGLARSG